METQVSAARGKLRALKREVREPAAPCKGGDGQAGMHARLFFARLHPQPRGTNRACVRCSCAGGASDRWRAVRAARRVLRRGRAPPRGAAGRWPPLLCTLIARPSCALAPCRRASSSALATPSAAERPRTLWISPEPPSVRRRECVLRAWCGLQILEETDRSNMVGQPKGGVGRDIASVIKIINALELRNEQCSS